MKVSLFVNHPHAPKIDRRKLSAVVKEVIREEGKSVDNINVVLVEDDYLLEVNRKFLKHDYRTDVISFSLETEGPIDGEVYVSVDRARVQARRYKIPAVREIVRLIVHGVLHLAGWEDGTRAEKLRMRKRENVFIERFFEAHEVR